MHTHHEAIHIFQCSGLGISNECRPAFSFSMLTEDSRKNKCPNVGYGAGPQNDGSLFKAPLGTLATNNMGATFL